MSKLVTIDVHIMARGYVLDLGPRPGGHFEAAGQHVQNAETDIMNIQEVPYRVTDTHLS